MAPITAPTNSFWRSGLAENWARELCETLQRQAQNNLLATGPEERSPLRWQTGPDAMAESEQKSLSARCGILLRGARAASDRFTEGER
jgi:hypothetical protein